MTSGNAITIATNNVVLDLNSFKLGGLSAGLGTNANGIYCRLSELKSCLTDNLSRFFGLLSAVSAT